MMSIFILYKFHHKQGYFGRFDGWFRVCHARNRRKSARKSDKNHRLYLLCNRLIRSESDKEARA